MVLSMYIGKHERIEINIYKGIKMTKHNFYDGDGLFEEFSKIRSNVVNFNDLVETSIR